MSNDVDNAAIARQLLSDLAPEPNRWDDFKLAKAQVHAILALVDVLERRDAERALAIANAQRSLQVQQLVRQVDAGVLSQDDAEAIVRGWNNP